MSMTRTEAHASYRSQSRKQGRFANKTARRLQKMYLCFCYTLAGLFLLCQSTCPAQQLLKENIGWLEIYILRIGGRCIGMILVMGVMYTGEHLRNQPGLSSKNSGKGLAAL